MYTPLFFYKSNKPLFLSNNYKYTLTFLFVDDDSSDGGGSGDDGNISQIRLIKLLCVCSKEGVSLANTEGQCIANIKEMNSWNCITRNFYTHFFTLQWSPRANLHVDAFFFHFFFSCLSNTCLHFCVYMSRFFCQLYFNFHNFCLCRDKESNAWGHNITWLDPYFLKSESVRAKMGFSRKKHHNAKNMRFITTTRLKEFFFGFFFSKQFRELFDGDSGWNKAIGK